MTSVVGRRNSGNYLRSRGIPRGGRGENPEQTRPCRQGRFRAVFYIYSQWFHSVSLTSYATHIHIPMLRKKITKVLVLFMFACSLVLSYLGSRKLQYGLDLTELVPKDSDDHKFLKVISEHFAFDLLTVKMFDADFSAPTTQRLVDELHRRLHRDLHHVVKKTDGDPSLQPWTWYLRRWLSEALRAYEKDRGSGFITDEGWDERRASVQSVLVYKLLAQTRNGPRPSAVKTNWLIRNGTIKRDLFPYAFVAWKSADPLPYFLSAANFKPTPGSIDLDTRNKDLEFPEVEDIKSSGMTFFLSGLINVEESIVFLKRINAIRYEFEKKGLSCEFSSFYAIPLFQQYLHLHQYLWLALACILGTLFVVMSLVLVNPWLSALVTLMLAANTMQLYGLMGFLSIQMNAIPVVQLIVGVGIGVEFTVHIALCFINNVGTRDDRMVSSLQHMFAPVIHGALSTLLGVIMLSFSELPFITKYLFLPLMLLVLLGTLNGLVVLPVILSFIGPPSVEVDYVSLEKNVKSSAEITTNELKVESSPAKGLDRHKEDSYIFRIKL